MMTRRPTQTDDARRSDACLTGPGTIADRGRDGRILILAAVVPLAATVFLYRGNIPLGCPGRFVYLYSPVVAGRLAAVPWALLIGLVLGLGMWLVATVSAQRRRVGFGLVTLGAVALAVWSYFAPPSHCQQHILNAHSPSHDGAFVLEALRVDSVRDYLRAFPERARTPPREMRGTRIVSNPPGATLLALGVERLLRRFPALSELASVPSGEALPASPAYEKFRHSAAVGLAFFWVLTALWLMAGLFLYLAGRLFLPPGTAAAYSLCCVFSPMTLLFTPGKDPAQLLTVALLLYLWLVALRRNRGWAAGLAGIFLVIGSVVSLVHLWLAAIIVTATLLNARHARLAGRPTLLRRACYAVGGALLAGVLLRFLCGLDLIATLRAVAHAQAEVTRGPDAMPLAWQLLGVPLFLLFVGPAWWTTTLWLAACRNAGGRDADARLGQALLLGSLVAMLGTVGFTNLETPRLWIPFTPLLLLGTLLSIEALRAPSRRVALVLAVLVGVQVAISALQWSVMDPREAETRLVEQRFFG